MRKVLLTLLILAGASPCFAKYSGGSGTAGDPYKIATPEDLNGIGNHPEDFNKYFIMTADINLAQYTGTQFNIIGNSTTKFTGVFDGNGHTISNFTFITSYRNDVGLFGVNSNSTILNLGIINPVINAGQGERVGGLVGYLDGSDEVENCYVDGGTISGYRMVGGLVGRKEYIYTVMRYCWSSSEVHGTWYVGGLVGENFDSDIYACYATGSVFGLNRVGGLVGDHSYGQITECYASGNVTKEGTSSTPNFHGGLVGYFRDGKIKNSYASGSVTGKYYAGGLAGQIDYGEVNDCYSVGYISGSSDIGGLVGSKDSDTHIYNSFWDINTSGRTTSAGGTGETTAEMKTLLTFTSAGWDFTNEAANGTNDYWRMCVDGVNYPWLNWQLPDGDLACPDGVNFVDFAYFAERWQTTGCNSSNNFCGGADFDFSGTVDINDLAVMCNYWLQGF